MITDPGGNGNDLSSAITQRGRAAVN